MFDATAPGFDGPAGCPTQSRIRFRRLWLRFFFFVRRRKNKKTKDARADARRVPGRETCPSRLNVVNTEFQLRHLIIWSSIFIHVTSESGDARVRNGLREQSVWAFGRLGARTIGADGASDGIRTRRRLLQRRASRFVSLQ
jgi:hypothetical protein